MAGKRFVLFYYCQSFLTINTYQLTVINVIAWVTLPHTFDALAKKSGIARKGGVAPLLQHWSYHTPVYCVLCTDLKGQVKARYNSFHRSDSVWLIS